jgi:UPF0716 protein FxsA
VRRVRWIPLVALVVFLAEIGVFIGLGELIGYPLAMLVILLVSLIGLAAARREGLRAWRRFRQAVEAGAPPGSQGADGVVGFGGALLLAAPGLLTGAAGLLLLTPPVRRASRIRLQQRAERRMSSGDASQMFGPRRVHVVQEDSATTWPPDDEVVEGDVVEGDVVDPPRGPGSGGGRS